MTSVRPRRPGEAGPAAPRGSAALRALRACGRRALPWLAGAGLLAALVVRVDAGELGAALAQGRLARYLPLACGFVLLWLALDAAVLSALFSRLVGPLSWRRTIELRAATYPAFALSFDAANAVLIGLVVRETGASLSRASGAMLVHYLCDLTALFGVALLASQWLAPPLPHLRGALAVLVLGLLATLLGLRFARPLLRARPRLTALVSLRLRELAALICARASFYGSFALFAWLTLPAFGLEVPALEALGRMPLVMGLGSLPLTPAGVGTTQAAMIALFGPFGGEARAFAYSIAYSATLLLLRLPLGFAAWARLGGSRTEECR